MRFYNPANNKVNKILDKAADFRCSFGLDELAVYLATLETYLEYENEEWKEEFNEWLAERYHKAVFNQFLATYKPSQDI